MSTSSTELLVFTCEGREHLLDRTMRSFVKSVHGDFSLRRLMVDGTVDEQSLESVRADVVTRQVARGGYVRSILTALRLVETEFFFWLEDDWEFEADVHIHELVSHMRARPDIVQIRLSKTGRLKGPEVASPLGSEVYESTVGFSANPCLCRTEHVRAGFAALEASPRLERSATTGFEEFLTTWYAERGLVCAALDSEGVRHLGYLESTPRQYHMMSAARRAADGHLFSMGASPPLWRRVWMAAKLARRFGAVTFGQLRDDAYYELAFRMVTVPIASKATR